MVTFDNPEIESFGRINQLVGESHSSFKFSQLVSGVAGRDAVDQGVTEDVFFFNPGLEIIA